MINIEIHKNIIQSSNLNFLIGSGFSRPFLPTLGGIEKNISEIEIREDIPVKEKRYIKDSLLNKYFIDVMYPNVEILCGSTNAMCLTTFENYIHFLDVINSIIQRRGSTIIKKQINIFTTNIDLFIEKAVEKNDLEFNDGFSGRITPTFSLSNYNKIISKCSHHFGNESKIPIFNILKIHGSLNWRKDTDGGIYCSFDPKLLLDLKLLSDKGCFLDVTNTDTVDSLKAKIVPKAIKEKLLDEFELKFGNLPLVNPTKAKFKETTLNLYYYELLRFLSNELEKENSVLYIMGFSMADEHIREIIIRAAKANPTLQIFIIAYNEDGYNDIRVNMQNKDYANIMYIKPDDGCVFDFQTINKDLFGQILSQI